MNTKNIIFGSLALVILGGGAYFFLKNKKKKDTLKLEDLKKLGESVTQTGTSTTTNSDKVLDTAPVNNQVSQAEISKQIQAQGLVNQIVILKNEYDTLQDRPNRPISCGFDTKKIGGQNSSTNAWMYSASSEVLKGCNSNLSQINNKLKQLTQLGYKEDKGLAVKI
jgi:hypothetical protein